MGLHGVFEDWEICGTVMELVLRTFGDAGYVLLVDGATS